MKTEKELYNKIVTLQNSLNSVVEFTPFVTKVEAEIRSVPLELMVEYGNRYGETLHPIDSAGYVHMYLHKFGEAWKTCITIISERQKITIEKY
jgi:hypothetical protein